MSEQTVVPTTPAAPVAAATTPDAGVVTTAAVTEPVQPFRTFASQEDLDKFVAKSKRQAERKALNDQAKALGYEDWEEMSEALQPLRRAGSAVSGDAPNAAVTPGPEGTVAAAPNQPTTTQPDEASRLRMALQVGTKLNLPTALVGRLMGATAEEMEADAQALLGLMTTPRGPGIPPAVQQGQPVTFTRKQLQDPAYVREHQAEILQAAREGRIVDS